MNILVKSLIVWLMLVAVPFQGFASATMLLCTPSTATSVAPAAHAAVQHDHAAMMGAVHQHHAAKPGAAAPAHHHADGKCRSCAACCVGAAMASSFRSDLTLQPVHSEFIPFDSGFQPAVDLALPERPPKSALA